MTDYKISEYANLFPVLPDNELDALADDIKKNGLLEPITVYKGEIIDGRNRYLACKKVGIEPTVKEWNGAGSIIDFIISENIIRRHLTPSQRAALSVELLPLAEKEARERKKIAGQLYHENSPKAQGHGQEVSPKMDYPLESKKAAEDIADKLHIGRQYVYDAKRIFGTADKEGKAPELKEHVISGRIELQDAKILSTMEAEERAKALAKKMENPKIPMKSIAQTIRNEERNTIPPPIPVDKFQVIYADPPWEYEHPISSSRAIENQYPTMTMEKLTSLKIPASDDSILFLWVTSPMLNKGLNLIEAWGFTYRTSMVWVKPEIGMGNYVRVQHEFLLIAVRGNGIGYPLPENKPSSVIMSDRRAHSQKPDEVYEIIEKMYPNHRKIELFARQKRDGWDAWGNEVR